MKMKIFIGPTAESVEEKVNTWLAEQGPGVTIMRGDTQIKEAPIRGRDTKGKQIAKKANYLSTTIFYEPPKSN